MEEEIIDKLLLNIKLNSKLTKLLTPQEVYEFEKMLKSKTLTFQNSILEKFIVEREN
jgi:hypothetical protein